MPWSLAAFTARYGSNHKIEILGDGQQVIVDGIHPDTGKAYSWHGGTPLTIPRDDLPYVRREDAIAFLAKASALLVEQFWFQPVGAKPKANGHDDGHHKRADWARLTANIIAGVNLHESLNSLGASYRHAMGDEDAIRGLQALMLASTAPHDDRWQERLDDIPRSVRGAKEKYGAEGGGPQSDGLESILASGVDMQGLEWFWPGRLGRGKLALLVGLPDKGKGLAACRTRRASNLQLIEFVELCFLTQKSQVQQNQWVMV